MKIRCPYCNRPVEYDDEDLEIAVIETECEHCTGEVWITIKHGQPTAYTDDGYYEMYEGLVVLPLEEYYDNFF